MSGSTRIFGQTSPAPLLKRSRLMIANQLLAQATTGCVEIRVVNVTSGATLFQMARTDSHLCNGMDGLRAKGVNFLVCRSTLDDVGQHAEDLYGVRPQDVVPNGGDEMACLQGRGFVYLHP